MTKRERVVVVKLIGRDSAGVSSLDRSHLRINENVLLTCSGIKLSEDFYITTATILFPFLKEFSHHVPARVGLEIMQDNDKLEWEPVEVEQVIEIPTIKHSIEKLTNFSTVWRIGWLQEEGQVKLRNFEPNLLEKYEFLKSSLQNPKKISETGIESFLLLKRKNSKQKLDLSGLQYENFMKKGEKIQLLGTPFGFASSTLFLNCLSEGIISNFIYEGLQSLETETLKKINLVITDARMLPGVEGGGVFSLQGSLMGICLPPIRRIDDAIILNFFLPINEVIRSLIDDPRVSNAASIVKCAPASSPEHISELFSAPSLLEAQKCSVLVKNQAIWGSGILISTTGHILTNAHIINQSQDVNIQVRVDYPVRKWYKAKILFMSKSAIDVALLQIICKPEKVFPAIKYDTSFKQGQPIYVIGHACWGSSASLSSTITSGILSKINYVNQQAVMFQTDAPIHKGNSGGMVINENGMLIGLVTCNATNQSAEVTPITIPTLNFCLPVSYITNVFSFIHEGNIRLLEGLHSPESTVTEVWRLSHGAHPIPDPPLSNKYTEYIKSRL